MDILPDEILLRIFAFLPFVKRITLRLVSWRWSRLLLDHSLLQQVVINMYTSCEDHQLEHLMSAAKRGVVEVDFCGCYNLTGSCLLSTDLSRLRKLTLTGTAIQNGTLLRILNLCKDELMELNLTRTRRISMCVCLPILVELKKLKYFAAPPPTLRNCSEGKWAVVELVERCQTLRALDCQGGYHFNRDDLTRIVQANPRLTSLVIPFSSLFNDTLMWIVESLSNLRYLCICETHVTQECVQRIKSSKPNLELCYNGQNID